MESEKITREMAEVPWTILRPPAVYGPRDRDFLQLFRTIKSGIVPLPFGGRQILSLVYGRDVAEAVRRCLLQEAATGKTYHVAAEPPVTTRRLVDTIAHALGKQVRTIAVSKSFLYVACLLQDVIARLQKRPSILSRQKWPELIAPGWVCAVDSIGNDLGFTARTTLESGIAQTASWYKEAGWL